MPRYFFHTEDGDSYRDDDGLELPDITAAKIEAVRHMGELLRDRAVGFWDDHALKLVVTDQAGQVLFSLDLSAVEAPAIRATRG
jgi:hypothetical protein